MRVAYEEQVVNKDDEHDDDDEEEEVEGIHPKYLRNEYL